MAAFIVGRESRSMGRRLSFQKLVKHASSYLRHKLHQVRLDLNDVTQAQLLVRKATQGRLRSPDASTLKRISRAAFKIDDYWRIVDVLHKRLEKLNGKRWRKWYQALTVLEHLVIHGPDSASREFQPDRETIRSQAAKFRHVDEGGFDWGLALRKRSERVLELLERGTLLREERERARAPIKGIQGLGTGDSGDGCRREGRSPFGVIGCRRIFHGDEDEDSSGKGALEVAEQLDSWSCGRRVVEETAAWKELEWGQEMMVWRGDYGRGAVTVGATCAAAAFAFAEESMPLLVDDSLLQNWF